MNAPNDPTYDRLLNEYVNAKQAYDIAVQKRQRLQDRRIVRSQPVIRVLDDWFRRPVGAPVDWRASREPEPAPKPLSPSPPMRIYLGPILGWAELVPWTKPESPQDPGIDWDVNALWDELSNQFFWDARDRFEKCKRKLLDSFRERGDSARIEIKDASKHQLRGTDDDESTALKNARERVEAGCKEALALYRRAGSQKTEEEKAVLLEWISNAQYVGLESSTVDALEEELDRLLESGQVRIEKPGH